MQIALFAFIKRKAPKSQHPTFNAPATLSKFKTQWYNRDDNSGKLTGQIRMPGFSRETIKTRFN